MLSYLSVGRRNRFSPTASAIASAVMLSVALLFDAACDPAGHKAAPEIASPACVYSADETADFKKLTKATLEALAAGKQTEMVAKLTDLETAWDDKEAVLRPRDEATWTLLDKTLDKGISALRSSKTDLHKGKAALEDLLEKLNQATKP